jgi:hypothetical protein
MQAVRHAGTIVGKRATRRDTCLCSRASLRRWGPAIVRAHAKAAVTPVTRSDIDQP